MKRSIIRIAAFLVILALVLGAANQVFRFKYSDGIYSMEKFYELDDDSVDVLILGSSHAFENFNTGTLWDEYGIASYALGAAAQPMWNTYYYLQEALKTQTPQLIVLEAFMTCMDADYTEDPYIIKSNNGLKWTRNKLEELKVSTPAGRFADFALEYANYHNRYTELSAADFLQNQGYSLYDDWKGFGCNMDHTEETLADLTECETRTPLGSKTETYYRAIFDLAASRGIPVLVAVSPSPSITADIEGYINTASDIAAEYGAQFVDGGKLVEEIGIDPAEDYAEEQHLNYLGNRKWTAYVGDIIASDYEVTDRRGDAAYSSWDKNAAYIRQQIEDKELNLSTDINDLADRLTDDNYKVFIQVNGDYDSSTDARLTAFMSGIGIDAAAYSGLWYTEGGKLQWSDTRTDPESEGQTVYLEDGQHDFALSRTLTTDATGGAGDSAAEGQTVTAVNSVIMDGESYGNIITPGINVIVYDSLTEKIADVFVISPENDCEMARPE